MACAGTMGTDILTAPVLTTIGLAVGCSSERVTTRVFAKQQKCHVASHCP